MCIIFRGQPISRWILVCASSNRNWAKQKSLTLTRSFYEVFLMKYILTSKPSVSLFPQGVYLKNNFEVGLSICSEAWFLSFCRAVPTMGRWCVWRFTLTGPSAPKWLDQPEESGDMDHQLHQLLKLSNACSPSIWRKPALFAHYLLHSNFASYFHDDCTSFHSFAPWCNRGYRRLPTRRLPPNICWRHLWPWAFQGPS